MDAIEQNTLNVHGSITVNQDAVFSRTVDVLETNIADIADRGVASAPHRGDGNRLCLAPPVFLGKHTRLDIEAGKNKVFHAPLILKLQGDGTVGAADAAVGDTDVTKGASLSVPNLMAALVENYRQQLLMKDAQLKSLEAQMNPHFLYNTLDAVNRRTKAVGEQEISRIAESLGHFLRMTLSRRSDNFTLSEELEIIGYYMTIQQLRFDNRLDFSVNVPEEYRDAMMPKLSIRPLLENAVHYALEQVADTCEISLSCVRMENLMRIYVKNTGSEFQEDLLDKLKNEEIKGKGLGIALLNIQERIQLLFGEQYGLRSYNEQNCAVVRMEIPYVPVREGEADA